MDAINLADAVVHNSPPDISSWPVGVTIDKLVMRPGQEEGLAFDFTPRQGWPDYTPPGWDGPLQYTVWAGVNMGGTWHIAGFIQMWRSRAGTGAPLLAQAPGKAVNNFAGNWAYDGRWGPLAGYQPHEGEEMVFFLSAGNARGEGGVTSVKERSNVVKVSLPRGDSGVFTFTQSPPAPPSPVEPPPPTPTPPPAPLPVDLAATLAVFAEQMKDIQKKVTRLGWLGKD